MDYFTWQVFQIHFFSLTVNDISSKRWVRSFRVFELRLPKSEATEATKLRLLRLLDRIGFLN